VTNVTDGTMIKALNKDPESATTPINQHFVDSENVKIVNPESSQGILAQIQSQTVIFGKAEPLTRKAFEDMVNQVYSQRKPQPYTLLGSADELGLIKATMNGDHAEATRIQNKINAEIALRDAKERQIFLDTYGGEQTAIFDRLNTTLSRYRLISSSHTFIWRLENVRDEIFEIVNMDKEYSSFRVVFRKGLYEVNCSGEYTDFAELRKNIPYWEIIEYIKSLQSI